jgi:hypothetical protein
LSPVDVALTEPETASAEAGGIITGTQEAIMSIDQDKLQEFLGMFVTDLGAAIAAGNVVVGHRLGCTAAWPRLRRPRSSWPSAPGPTGATSPSGCAGRPRAGMPVMTPPRMSSR